MIQFIKIVIETVKNDSPREKFGERLKTELKIEPGNTKKIISDVEKQIFSKIKKDSNIPSPNEKKEAVQAAASYRIEDIPKKTPPLSNPDSYHESI